MGNDDRDLLAADASLDQEAEALKAIARNDLDGWARLIRKLRNPLVGKFTPDEVKLSIRLADFGATVISGRMVGRKV